MVRRMTGVVLIACAASALQADIASASLSFTEKARLSMSNAGPQEVFGLAVAIDGDTALVGAPFADLGPVDFPGAVNVYVRRNGAWVLDGLIQADDAQPTDLFGASIALQGDTLMIGALHATGPVGSQGAVYVFTRGASGIWSQTQKFTSGTDAAAFDAFGYSIALDGDTAVVSAISHASVGAAWIFTRSGGSGSSWTKGAKLLANDPRTAAGFGYRVAISGGTVLIGSPVSTTSGGTFQGAVFVFTRNGSTWGREAKLVPAGGPDQAQFGTDVAIQQNTALIGAPCPTTSSCTGAAYAFTRIGTVWQQQAALIPSDRVDGDAFGMSVSLASPYALIGARTGPPGDATGSGEAHVFSRSGTSWTEQAVLRSSDAAAQDQFGSSVALSRSVGIELTAIIGAPHHNPQHGAAYIYSNLPPSLSITSDASTPEDVPLRLPFTIGDGETPADSLALDASASDPVVASVSFEGTGTNRTLVITPAANLSGQATIDLTVSDDNFSAQTTLRVTVTPVDDPPTLSAIADQTATAGTPTAAIPFTLDDIDTPLDSLIVSATSSNPALVPPGGIHLGGSGAARTIAIAPAASEHGSATLTVTVDDGTTRVSGTFTLTVSDPTRTYYLAEGSTGAFFDTDLLLANPNEVAAPITITYFKENGNLIIDHRTLAPLSRTTIHVDEVPGMAATSFSTAIASPTGLPLVAERTMRWDASGYGAHGEKATEGAASQWYFAEGSQGYFYTFFLLVNPQPTANTAHLTYFREGEAPLVRSVPLPPVSRVTVYAGDDPELVNRSFGALVAFDQPGTAERAMYFGTDPLWSGGHDSVGVTTPSPTWFLAEGATGSFFNTFVLLANPGTTDATATLTYLPDTGKPVTRQRLIPAGQRVTINIATEDPSLASAAVSTRVDATQPVLVERSQYWPAPAWYEGHNSFGLTATATRWGLAEGRVGGPSAYQTYILLANPGDQPAAVTVRFLRTSGPPLVKTFTVKPSRRFNIAVTGGGGGDVPELQDEDFGAIVESTQPIAVERALYSNANGVTWAAGTNATATPLP
jgi:hypothetical protein